MSIGENVKRIRKEKKLTQKELADSMMISRSYLSDIENNRKNPSSKTLESLAEKLNVSMLYLTTGKKALADLSHEEKKEVFKGTQKTIKEQKEKMQSKLKYNIKELLESELSYVETIYLTSAINFLKSSNEKNITTLTALLVNLNRYNEAGKDDEIAQDELLDFIKGETKLFEEFLKQLYHYDKKADD